MVKYSTSLTTKYVKVVVDWLNWDFTHFNLKKNATAVQPGSRENQFGFKMM